MPVRIVGIALWLAVVAVVAGCGGGGKSSSSTTPSGPGVKKDAKVAAEVPAAVRKKGTITVAADASYPPNEFIGPDGHTVIGMDVDLANALGAVMGLKTNVTNAPFDSIIPGLSAKKYDVGMSSFTDTKERQKVVDFVTYFTVRTAFFEKAQGGPKVNGLADLCGVTVAVEKGTTQADDANAQGKKCKAAGKKGVTVLIFPDQNGANLALSSGRAQLGMADYPVAAYQVKKTNGQFKLVGQTYGPFPYGIAVPKGTGMTRPLLSALKVLIRDGRYKAILTQWGVPAGAISNPKINGATS
ncbi:MAG: ABC transporter substrate-binding protein [Actinomycetota bacterium]|nr:ABC transporter substrate-binding protein [Actinomycetota bacterium]